MIPRNPNLPNLKRVPENDKLLNAIAINEIDPLYNIALWLTGNSVKAKRLLKQSYYSAMEFYDQTYITTDYKGWIYRILLKRFTDKFNKPDKPNEKGINLINVLSEDEIRIDGELLSEKYLLDKISELPTVLKLVIVLHDVHGFDYKSTGELADIPDGVVSMRLYRARMLLLFSLHSEPENSFRQKIEFTKDVETDYLLASITDLESLDSSREKTIKEKLLSDQITACKLRIQDYIKNIIKETAEVHSPPALLKKRIIRRINKSTLTE